MKLSLLTSPTRVDSRACRLGVPAVVGSRVAGFALIALIALLAACSSQSGDPQPADAASVMTAHLHLLQ